MTEHRIGLGGGCHWCTESVFLALDGVTEVAQGFIRSVPPADAFSEAVLINFDPEVISYKDLIEIHLQTHASTSEHALRNKYRSAIYVYSCEQENLVLEVLKDLQQDFSLPLLTKVLPFAEFKWSDDRYHDYYAKHKQQDFCQRYIEPKLALLRKKYPQYLIDVADN